MSILKHNLFQFLVSIDQVINVLFSMIFRYNEKVCAENSLTFLTYDDIMEIKRLGKERSNEVHIQYAKLKYLIEQLITKEEVEAITFDTDTSAIVLEV